MRHIRAVFLTLLCASAPVFAADKVDVAVPVRLDYPLLRQLLVRQLFTDSGESRQVLRDAGSCNQIVLTDPRLAPRRTNIEIDAQVAAKLGISIFGLCVTMLEWQGGVGFQGLPVIKPGGTSVALKPQDLWLHKADGERLTSGRLWDYAHEPLQKVFSSFTINLSPLTRALGSFLPDVLPNRSGAQLQETLDSLKLGNVQVSAESLNASLNFSVEPVAVELPPETVLTPEELQQWESRWQLMDAVLVFAVKHYAAATRMEDLRSTLLDILIDSRYQLVEALAEPVDPSRDVVRGWFVESWQTLSPVVRTIALEQEGTEPLMWMSVLAATDALYALDRIGPQVGLLISTDGLRRLARMINHGVEPQNLRYDEAVDPELQELFHEQMQRGTERTTQEPSAWNFNLSPIPRAYAAAPGDKLNNWVPGAEEIPDYLPLVSTLLRESSDSILKTHKLDKTYHGLFRNLVLATAWQESCWRQYVVKDDKIEPLISSTGDIGLMQLNERIWRGFYDLQKLRWDIAYNSFAGSEVLLDYLLKYAISRNEHRQPGGLDNLARASYSAYNGGPGRASRYRKADVPSKLKKIDSAFWKKYQRINEGDQGGIARCLGAVT